MFAVRDMSLAEIEAHEAAKRASVFFRICWAYPKYDNEPKKALKYPDYCYEGARRHARRPGRKRARGAM